MIENLNHLTPSEYRLLNAVSQSDLKAAYENPQLYHERWPRTSSKAQEWGTGLESFLRHGVHDVTIIPDDVLSTNGQRRGSKWEEWCVAHSGRVCMKQREYDDAFGAYEIAVRNVRQHEMANRLIYSPSGQWHQRFAWDCEVTGMLLKGEMDIIDEPLACVTDLKSAADVDPHSFRQDAIKWGYDIQAAMYLRAASLLLCDVEWSFAWVVVRNKPPYNVEVYEASAELLEYGNKRLDERLRFYHECRISGRWVTPTHGLVQTLYPPRYVKEMV